MKTEPKDFGTACAKCRAIAGVRIYCTGCKEIRGRDHHHCACTVCGYGWVEKPADAPKVRKGGRR